MTDKYIKRIHGFTLVELSIVIIIIGFLIAGIAAGQSLIKQAQLNAIINEMDSIQTAYITFKLRYNGVPGDLTSGGAFFPNCSGNPADSISYCSGDGDGMVSPVETYSTWRELYLAGLISSNIDPVPAHAWGESYQEVLGSTIPISKLSNAGYRILGYGPYNNGYNGGFYGSPIQFYDQINSLWLGGVAAVYGLGTGVLTPQDAFNIDSKIDDGTIDSSSEPIGAHTGNFRAGFPSANSLFCLTDFYGNVYDFTDKTASCLVGKALD
jgi:prepilin-type N-terminal cleavage/methylation domain-containing protein